MIGAYPSIYALGHKAVAAIFSSPVVIQEKIDGSQFSMRVTTYPPDGPQLMCRSKSAQLQLMAPEALFHQAVKTAKARQGVLQEDWVYCCEYLARPKHNALVYDRIPRDHLILFDVRVGREEYLSPGALRTEGERVGLEVVPLLHSGAFDPGPTGLADLRAMLSRTSVLGGQLIEGVVVKNYALWGPDGKVLMAKFVSEQYKETHAVEWKHTNPAPGDVVAALIRAYQTPARWRKAVQHLAERGELEGSPRDIQKLFAEVPDDVLREEGESIRARLMEWAWPKVRRGLCAGLPEWYKEELLKKQFEAEGETS